MGRATNIIFNGNICALTTSNGLNVELEINNEWTEITFKYINGQQFGEFVFKDLEDGSYKLMRMYSEPNDNGGIGRVALELFKRVTNNIPIYVSPIDGETRDDQSHLTEIAPIFVPKMITAGLIIGYKD